MKNNHRFKPNYNISKVIELSYNYKKHKQVISSSRPAIDFTDIRHMNKIDRLSNQRGRYSSNVKNYESNRLKLQNQRQNKRIGNTISVYSKQFNPEGGSKSNNKSFEPSASRRSLTSSSSCSSVRSNFRRRTIREQEISRQNKKLADRICNPKKKKTFEIDSLNKFFDRQKRFSNIRSKFSDRSQSVMKNLALDSLRYDKKHVQYLPQLSSKKVKIVPSNKGRLNPYSKIQ